MTMNVGDFNISLHVVQAPRCDLHVLYVQVGRRKVDVTYDVPSVVSALKMRHAIQATVACGMTLAAVRIEFLLGQDVAATLSRTSRVSERFPR